MSAPNGTTAELRAAIQRDHATWIDNVIASLSEHHDRAAVEDELTRFLVATERGSAEEALRRERVTREARRTVDLEDAERQLRLPPTRDDYSLASYLAEPKTPKVERVEQLQRAGHHTVLIAAYKTGKTTLHANLTRSLVDGDPFLDHFAVKQPQGRVGVWNAEMDSDDYEQYLKDAGVQNAAGVAIWNLRGYRLPLLSDVGRDAAVEWLTTNGVSYWIVDPWARVCSWSAVDENSNAEVLSLLQRVDEIADAAGVGEVLIVHHAGYAPGRPRGASALADWGDGLWFYSRDDSEDGDGQQRYLRVEGRGVGQDERLIEFEGGRTTFRDVGRRRAKLDQLAARLAHIVEQHPNGISTSEAQNRLTGNNAAKVRAVEQAAEAALIRIEADPADKRRKLLFPSADGGLSL